MKSSLKKAIPYTFPILTGYAFLGLAYGLLMNRSGLEFYWVIAMSTIVFAGALQFAAIPLLIGVFNPIAAFILALLVNIRHIFYGISMLSKYRNMGIKKFFTIYMMADEAFSIQAAVDIDDGVDAGWFYFWIALIAYLYWNLFCLSGFFLGQFVPTTIQGFDFVLTALFYILFLNQWEHHEHRPYLLIGVGATLLSLMLLGQSNFLMGSMLLIIVSILFMKEKKHD